MSFSLEHLVAALRSTFSPNENERKEAESFLTAGSRENGFAQAVLEVFVAQEADLAVRQAAGLQLKNLVRTNWEGSGHVVSDQDKALVRSHILSAGLRCASSPPLFKIFVETVRLLISRDFPEQWADLVQNVSKMMDSGDEGQTLVGLQCLRQIAREFQMKLRGKGRDPLDAMTAEMFPKLLVLAEKLVSTLKGDHKNESALEMMKLVCKIFFSATSMHITSTVANPDSCRKWFELFTQIIHIDFKEEEVEGEDQEEKQKAKPGKLQKWTLRILWRFAIKLGGGSLSVLSSNRPDASEPNPVDMEAFSKFWMQTFAPVLTQQVMEMLKRKYKKGSFVSNNAVNLCLSFLGEAVKHSACYKIIKPNLEFLVFEVVFPVLRFNESDHEMWQSDPEEFLRRQNDCEFNFADPRMSSRNFLGSMVSLRPRDCMLPMLKFIESNLEGQKAAPSDLLKCQGKDGALAMLGCVAEKFCMAAKEMEQEQKEKAGKKGKKKKGAKVTSAHQQLPSASMLEQILHGFVLPDFASPVSFLRYRACWCYLQFIQEELPISSPAHMGQALEGVKRCMADSELPVRVQAGEAMGVFLVSKSVKKYPEVKQKVAENVPDILDKILKMMGEIDSDNLSATLENLIASFGDAVLPFADQACHQLSRAFCRMVESGDEETEAAAMGVMGTLETLMDACGKNPEVFSKIAPHLVPLLELCFSPNGMDYFDSACNILAALTFHVPEPLTPELWTFFDLMHQAVCGGNLPTRPLEGEIAEGYALDFLPDMVSPLDNFVSRGSRVFLEGRGQMGKTYQEMLYEIVAKGLWDVADSDPAAAALSIASLIFEHSPSGAVDASFERYLSLIWPKMNEIQKSKKLKLKSYLLLCLMMWNNSQLFVDLLEKSGISQAVFAGLFQEIPLFKTLEDRKILVLSLCNLLRLGGSLPSSLQQGLQHVVLTLAKQTKEISDLRAKVDARKLERLRGSEEESSDDEDEFEDDELAGLVGDLPGLLQDLGEDQDADQTRDQKLAAAIRERLRMVHSSDEDDEEDDSDYEDESEDEDEVKLSPLDNFEEFLYISQTLSASPPALQEKVREWVGGQKSLGEWEALLSSRKHSPSQGC